MKNKQTLSYSKSSLYLTIYINRYSSSDLQILYVLLPILHSISPKLQVKRDFFDDPPAEKQLFCSPSTALFNDSLTSPNAQAMDI